MNSRTKAILSTAVGFLTVLLAIWALDRWTVQPAFEALEYAQALENSAATAQRASHTLVGALGLAALALLIGRAAYASRAKHDEVVATAADAWRIATLIFMVGLALTAGLSWTLRTTSQETLKTRFQQAAAERTDVIIERLRGNLRDLDAIRRFFVGSDLVSRDEFRQFVTPILDYHGFQALEWLPRVPLAQRADYEAAARDEGLSGFQFTERNAQGALVAATDRAEYFPVYYLEPYAGNEAALGFAPAPSHPSRGVVLTQAWDSGQIAISGRYQLVQERNQQFSVLAFAPVYHAQTTATDVEERRRQLKGFVLGVMRISDVVEAALAQTEPQGLLLRLLDLSAEGEQQLLYTLLPRIGTPQLDAEPSLWHRQDFPLADRLWRVEVQPNALFIKNNTDGLYYWVPAAGVLLTLLAALYGFTLTSQRQRAEALVAARTVELRASEEHFRLLYEQAPVAYQSLDAEGRIIEVNPCWQQLFGYGREEVTGRWVGDFLAPDQLPLLQIQLAQFKTTDRLHNATLDFLHRTGRRITVSVESRIGRDAAGQFQQTHCVLYDLTERQRTEERQRLAGAVFDAVRESIVVTDPNSAIVAVNPAFTALSGYAEAEVLGKNPRLLQSGHQPPAFYTALWETLRREDSWQGEFWNQRKDGSLYVTLTTLSAVRDEAGRLAHYVSIATDITRQKEAEQRIERLAYYDTLTGLPNRTLLIQRAEQALSLAAQREGPLALLFVDIDRFKEINDSLGHVGGDALLAEATVRLQALTQETDTVCRLGSDEFVLLLPEADQTKAAQLADQALAAFRRPFTVAGHSLRATVSIGIARYPHDGSCFADLLKNADAALHQAKQDGRNTRMFYAPEMNVAALERLTLESELRQAIDSGQLIAYFQPKVRLADGALAGAEALVRWHHPVQGLIPPGRFIPVAEASDLIVAIGDWMLEAVCQQQAIWRETGLPVFTIAVNLAARHFRDPGLIQHIQTLLTTHCLTTDALELELTESTLLEAGAQTLETLVALRRLGVGLAIDDFGTGYSSLGYLKRLPITALKIDQSFVRELETEADDRTLAATIVALGHSLGLSVVAEGVETEEQRRILLEQGCDLAQGYYFGRPMPAEQFADWITHSGVET
jgi:diguanylate cyclase (GGDEF)-like protein/PAS domain S-box-containing protein